MMAVLAITGVLSLAAYYTFRVLMEKYTANTILENAQVTYIEMHSRHEGIPADWQEVTQKFKSVSQSLTFFVKRDPLQNDYVKVGGVEQRVCYQLLNMQVAGKLAFYNDNNEQYTTCAARNDMIIAFNGQGIPAECATITDCDLSGDYGEEGFQGYCTATGRCHQCDPEFEEVNEDRTACICDAEKALSCTDDETGWCCGEGLICDIPNKSCKNGEGKCTFYFYEADNTTEYTTNCSYSLSSESNVKYYYSDCYYEVGTTATTANMTTKDIGNTPQTYDNPTVTGAGGYEKRGGCPANKYCALFWQGATPHPEKPNQYTFSSNPSTTSNNGLTGRLYGKCQTLSGYDSTPLTENKTGAGMMVGNEVRGGCPENQYCALIWKQESWSGTTEPKLGSGDTGTMYGKCQTLSGYDTTPLIGEDSSFAQYRMGQGCPAGQYCRILWVKGTCTGAQNGDKGEFSGTCISLSPPTPSTINCPY